MMFPKPNKSLQRTQAAFVTRLAMCEKPRQAARQTGAPLSSPVRIAEITIENAVDGIY